MREQGITIYTEGDLSTWVNGGILFKVKSSGKFLTKEQKMDIHSANVFDRNDFDADMVLSMGGDGTFLKAASYVGNKNIPILGINTGRLGFLIAQALPISVQWRLLLNIPCAFRFNPEIFAVYRPVDMYPWASSSLFCSSV